VARRIALRTKAEREQARHVDYITIVAVALIVLAVIGAAWIHFGR
jgi:CHASE3 domain sensor protein